MIREPQSERSGQQGGKSQEFRGQLVIAIHLIKDQQQIGLEFGKYLATGAAGKRHTGEGNPDGRKTAKPLAHCSPNSSSFGADGEPAG